MILGWEWFFRRFIPMENSKEHCEKIYSTKNADEVSWTQEIPETSLSFIHSFNVPKNSAIIYVGGGESKFVDFLLDEGYSDITVLDISEQAIKKNTITFRWKSV